MREMADAYRLAKGEKIIPKSSLAEQRALLKAINRVLPKDR